MIIDEEGRFVHCRLGKHRLAIARILGLERMPVVVRSMSGTFVVKFVSGWQVYWPERLKRGVEAAMRAALSEGRTTD